MTNRERFQRAQGLLKAVRISYDRYLRWKDSPSQTWRSIAEQALGNAQSAAQRLVELLKEEAP